MAEPIEDPLVIGSLLPHSGAMCLLHSVHHWNERHIECRANSHVDPHNPLRNGECLPVHAGIEYLAQAMAIHGTLCQSRAGHPRMGYLAVLSDVDWHCSRLDDLPGELRVLAQQLAVTTSSLNYAVSLYFEQRILLAGRALVVLPEHS